VVEVCPEGAELTIAQIAERTCWHVRRVQRLVARWEERGWPRVRRERCRGNPRGRLLVSEADFNALLAGERPADPEAEAA
jgi:transposase